MEEVSVTLSLNNPIYDNNVELTTLKLITEAATLLSDAALDLIPDSNNDVVMVEAVIEGGRQPNIIDVIDTTVKCDTSIMGIEKNDLKFEKIVPMGVIAVEIEKAQEGEIEKICMENGENGRKFEKIIPLGAIAVEIEETVKGKIVGKVISLEVEKTSPLGVIAVGIEETEKVDIVSKIISLKNQTTKVGSKSVFELEWVPLWGSVSICGKRPEMEDVVAIIPRFMKVPMNMFVGDHVINSLSQNLSHITSHFFGVYDGHGGSQVAEYCRERIHYALAEELNDDICNTIDKNITDNRQVEWQKAFTNCFQKVDDEVGGKAKRGFIGDDDIDTYDVISEPVAPETVGSTAVVALISSSHIIVSNCGDSRAVLYRGKEPVPLSVDHKPSREDEYERIEASGGKVIQWNGHRVFGVLAMSRSIGDRYLKPWIIPEPEVTFIPRTREDECLILASDGLWDVMTNEEVCEITRRRILLWHKKNGDLPLGERGVGVDPAAQAAAEYLSITALQKGSKDNISIIVVDLKAQRKFKTKS